jgi:uncharacterized protein
VNRLKLSQFVVAVPYDESILLYNTFSRALIRIDPKTHAILQRNPNHLSENLMSVLRTQGFLVSAEVHEGKLYLEYLSRSAQQGTGEMSVTLLVAYGCPLACSYCYQKDTHTGKMLKEDQTEKVVDFLKTQCEERDIKYLYISFYGGEPLLNPKSIIDVSTQMRLYCQERGIQFQFGMVTSGVLLTRKRVESLLPLGFVNVQVTIDGDEQTHDSSRPFKSGMGTYTAIMENLEQYAGLIHTDILCVLNEERIEATYRLIDTLAEKGLASRRVRMRFSPEAPTYDNETLSAPIDEAAILWAEKTLAVEIARLSVYAEARGLIDDLRPQRTWCAMQRHDASHITIGLDGTIHTCPTFMGRDDKYKAGHIDTGLGGIDLEIQEKYIRSEQCLECAYLPICADCRVDALYKKGDILAANSHEDTYDLIVPELVKGHYKSLRRSQTP